MAYGEKNNTIGEWSIFKLEFLEYYLPLYAKATKKAKHRYFIDAFAGNGKWIHRDKGIEVPGSAEIALRNIEGFTEMHFIEMEKNRVESLISLVKSYSSENKAFVHQGDCNELIPSILDKINKKAPTFVFLDPSGDQVRWKTIEILSQWKTELFILYPWNMTLARYLPRNKNITERSVNRLNNFFGTHEWYEIYMRVERPYLMSELLNLYMRRLKEIGYPYNNISNVIRSSTGQKLYYMIWVGKHKAGKEIMDWVYRRQQQQLTIFDFY